MAPLPFRGRPPLPVLIRWATVGLIFMAFSTGLLYVLVRWMGLNVPVATFICAEVCTILRYGVNTAWVFHGGSLSWIGLWKYHVANAAAFSIWWVGANGQHLMGMNYLLASVLAVGFSTGFSFASNYYWVWRMKHPANGA